MKRARHELWRSAEVSRLVALLSSERDYLASVLDAIPIAVAVLSENLTVEAGNAAFWHTFNLPQNAGVGRPVGEISGDAKSAMTLWAALEKGEDTIQIGPTEFLVRRLPDGDEIVLAASLGVVPAAAPPAAPVTKAEDHRTPPPDLFAERMRAVSRLAGGLSHELNNVLTVITSYGHLALEQLRSAGLPTDDVDAMVHAANDAARLGSELVALGGRHVTQEQHTDLNLLLASMEGTPPLRLADSVPPILSDPRQLERALGVIMRHAGEVTSEPGSMTVSTHHERETDSVVVRIADTRVWPDAKAGLAMFEPYSVYPGTRKSAALSLAVAWSILRQSRAEVAVNTRTEGTEIVLKFPTAERARTADTAPARETVLLVDDNLQLRGAVRHMLERQGYDVLEVGNPAEALRLCEEHPSIRILLSDINMPEMSGRELAEKAKRLRPELRVIMMSGYADEEIDVNDLGDSSLVFLQKPFTPDRLLRTVRGIAGRT